MTAKSTESRPVSELHDLDHGSHHEDDSHSIVTIPTSSIESADAPTHLDHLSHQCSLSHDAAPIHQTQTHFSIDDSVYDRLSNHRKLVIVALLSYCGFLAPISSTTVLVAVPEVAAEYNSTGSIINLSNALYLVFMGISPCLWGPLSQVYGRRWICITTSILFTACSIGTALAPNLAAFFVFRILTAIQGTTFLIVGSSVLGDIYRPTERATAMGWFLSGTLLGPAFGPFIGGVIVNFTSWRVIFYLQTGLGGLAAILSTLLLPETTHYAKIVELKGLPLGQQAKALARMSNPWRVLRLYRYPNLIIVCVASSSLVFNMYSLLTPIRYVLNPRFGLTSPILGGLFYLAPGFGYLTGTFFGGRYADHIVKKYIKRRGERVAEDRLRAAIPFMGIVIPGCMLIYGWSVDRAVGGVALPVIMMFLQGVSQLFCFPSLNTYCLDVMQSQSAEVISGNYLIRYLFGALGSALVLPAVERIGVGWFNTISAGFLVVSAVAVAANVRWGRGWRDEINGKGKPHKARNNKNGVVNGTRGVAGADGEAVEAVGADVVREKGEGSPGGEVRTMVSVSESTPAETVETVEIVEPEKMEKTEKTEKTEKREKEAGDMV